jgi:ribosomal protein S18 acetylase RimI-like enzyme
MDGVTSLEMFDLRSAPVVAGWAGTPDESMLWCSLPDVTADIVEGWARRPDVEAFVLRQHELVVAYGEIWIDVDEREVELAHLIVDPDRRGEGLGGRLVAELVDQARRHYPLIAMRVHSNNAAAIRCYTRSGFELASAADTAAWNAGQPVDYVWLTHPVDATEG